MPGFVFDPRSQFYYPTYDFMIGLWWLNTILLLESGLTVLFQPVLFVEAFCLFTVFLVFSLTCLYLINHKATSTSVKIKGFNMFYVLPGCHTYSDFCSFVGLLVRLTLFQDVF